jgi:hypothetical protein
MSFPLTDESHIQVNSTTIFIVIAFLLWKLYSWWENHLPTHGKTYGMVSAIAGVGVVAAPFLWSIKLFLCFNPAVPAYMKGQFPRPLLSKLEAGTLKSYPEMELDLARAKGLRVPLWGMRPLTPFAIRDTIKVIDFIQENTTFQEEIFVMGQSQIIYFLAERESVLQKENYFGFIAAVDLIEDPSAIRLTDDQLLQNLTESMPLFTIRVREGFGKYTERMVELWPESAAFIDENYELTKTFGIHEILQPRVSRPVSSS